MGLGQSNNYNERDFEEKPLEDEEIETLLEELPSSKKLMSLTGEEKIKILKATSDEKIYNTVVMIFLITILLIIKKLLRDA